MTQPVTGKRAIAVTGASGFVGSRVVRRALAAGRPIIALCRSRGLLGDFDHPQLIVRHWKIGDPIPEGVDAVCHAAAHIPSNYADRSEAEECFRVNALGALEALEASIAAKSKQFVLLSTGQIYARKGRPAKEDDAVYPAERAVYYLSSKMSAELFVENRRRAQQFPAAVLRLSSVYGPGMRGDGVMMRFALAAAAGATLNVQDGGVYRADFIHVDDVAAATLSAIDRRTEGVFNIGSGVTTSSLDLARIIVDVFGRDATSIKVAPSGSGAGGFDALDIAKARERLGFEPRSVEVGVRQWLGETNSLKRG
jgi:UDP-glucose 4-epimerase